MVRADEISIHQLYVTISRRMFAANGMLEQGLWFISGHQDQLFYSYFRLLHGMYITYLISIDFLFFFNQDHA